MGLIDSLTGLFGRPDAPTFKYQCSVCHHEFDSTERDMARVTCDSCGAHRIRALPSA